VTEQTPATPEPVAAPYSALPAAEPKKGGGVGKIIGGVVVALIVIAAVAVFKFGLLSKLDSSNPANAASGACLTDAPKVEDVKVVDCGSADAKHKVLAVLENKTEAEALSECEKVQGAEAYLITYDTKNITASSKGRVLCTGPKV
jgi:hypothetical protein